MRHEILYQPSFSLAVVSLERGESIMAESGAMISMSPTIKLKAHMSGGGVFGASRAQLVASRSSARPLRPNPAPAR